MKPTDAPHLHVDRVLVALGSLGKYQLLHIALALCGAIPSAFQLMSNVFTCRQVQPTCSPAPNETAYLERVLSSQYRDTNLTVSYEKCGIDVISGNTTVFTEEHCPFGVSYELPRDYSAVSEFDLVCDHDALAKLTQTFVIIGQGIGALFSTFFSDKFGRKPIFVGCNIGSMVFSVLAGFAPNYPILAMAKFFLGFMQQGMVTGYTTIIIEILPLHHRRIAATAYGLYWGFCNILLAGVSYLLRNQSWRTIQAVYSFGSIFVILQIWLMDESIRWLLANGKTEKAMACLKRAAQFNGKSLDMVMKELGSDEPLEKESLVDASSDGEMSETRGEPQKLSLIDLLRVRRLLINSLAIWFMWFTATLGFFALYLTADSLSANLYLAFSLTAFMEIPPNIFLYLALNRLGRRLTTGIPFAVMSAALLLTGFIKSLERSSANDILALLTSLLAMAGTSASFNAVYLYTPEMFPTNIRNQALGVASFMGRIGGMLAPFTSVLAEKGRWLPGAFMGGCACVVCLLLLILPETKHRELPQTLEDLQAWYQTGSKKDQYEIGEGEREGKV